jgi:hypothetical protein
MRWGLARYKKKATYQIINTETKFPDFVHTLVKSMTSVLTNFSLGTSGSPDGCKASSVRDANHCSDIFYKSIDLATPLAPSAHISALFASYKNQLQKYPLELFVSANTPTLRTRPRIPVDVTSNLLEPQLTVVSHPRERPKYHIKGPLTERASYEPGKISNDQSSTSWSTERLGRRERRYHTRLCVKLILVRKFKRRNQHVESGNNKEGRKGKLRCDACRKIKSKVSLRL